MKKRATTLLVDRSRNPGLVSQEGSKTCSPFRYLRRSVVKFPQMMVVVVQDSKRDVFGRFFPEKKLPQTSIPSPVRELGQLQYPYRRSPTAQN
jgi:hypothetical protein